MPAHDDDHPFYTGINAKLAEIVGMSPTPPPWSVYPTPVELVGGAHDGAVVAPGFSFDLKQLRDAFESVIAFGWNAQGLTSFEGPYIHIEGVFQGREVCLQVLAHPPEDEEPGLKVDSTGRPRKLE